jgi:hypothetical protein
MADLAPPPEPPRKPDVLPPVKYRPPAGFSIGNWIWRKFVAPSFGG